MLKITASATMRKTNQKLLKKKRHLPRKMKRQKLISRRKKQKLISKKRVTSSDYDEIDNQYGRKIDCSY